MVLTCLNQMQQTWTFSLPKLNKLVFAKHYEFSSPSAAASVIHGGQANGLREWKDVNGISLKELEQKDIANKAMDSDEE